LVQLLCLLCAELEYTSPLRLKLAKVALLVPAAAALLYLLLLPLLPLLLPPIHWCWQRRHLWRCWQWLWRGRPASGITLKAAAAAADATVDLSPLLPKRQRSSQPAF
jgi:hypothetical protein